MLKAPFPYFGGKSTVAHIVWQRFGDVRNYVEPFAGSLAVLLNRPHDPKIETVNDIDCYIANFWRALANDPDGVARFVDWPVNEADLHARHYWLVKQEDFRTRMKTDPDYYDVKVAGWWVWGICQWIGSGFCEVKYGRGGMRKDGTVEQQRPHLGDAGRGVHRPSQQLPHLGDAGMGIHRPSQQLPHLGDAGMGDLYDYMLALAERLRRVRVCCGDWSRVCGPTPTFKQGLTGVFLDPPYANDGRDTVYANDCYEVAKDVEKWCIENQDNPLLRIALCGYDGDYHLPGWACVEWRATAGYTGQARNGSNGNETKERIWFSPYCIPETRYEQLEMMA